MQDVFRAIELVAETDSSVLILGETGTGKELVARAIHRASRRKAAVMVKMNCAALPATLIESELFGHERGAFTGAVQQRKGRFELANRGTIFLDEVGELPLEAQVKLLRVLQEHEFERVGGTQTVRVDARVIAATNRDLAADVQRGTFRSDLYFRLNIFPIRLPALRDRREDIAILARHFLREFAARLGRPVDQFDARALDRLVNYDWPGNVRELANILERAVILCQGRVLQADHLGLPAHARSVADDIVTLEEAERRHIRKALEQTGGVLAGPKGAAALLGLNRSTLWSRMKKLGIDG
jgi:transcriptional regulator with GAF, ATPase, and Fis domain